MPSPSPPRLTLLVSLAAALAGASAGCAEEFDPYNRLTALRVLAIRSEPPTPGPGETATLSALVYAPPDEPPLSYEWSWCPMAGPAGEGYPCLVSPEQVAMLEQAGIVLPPFDLGSGPTATLAHTIDPALIAQLCAGTAGVLPQLPDCEGGFPVKIRLTVRSGDRALIAVRDLRLRFDPATEPNQNPVIEGILAEAEVDRFVPVTEQEAPTLPRDEETVIRALVSESQSEEYSGRDIELRPARVRELLMLTWFIESGSTRSEQTSFIFGEVPIMDAVSNEWTPARTKDYAGDRSRVIVVLRDSRGGVSWTEGAVTLGGDPP
jgi:hypothetical protein